MTSSTPLAERMRPKKLDDYVGQKHLVGEGAILRTILETGNVPSLILWGPPGVGKTTLAYLFAHHLKRPFYSLSAINSGVKEIREVIEKSKSSSLFDEKSPILFIDEIHRFSKSQQDSLLGAVEKGIVTLIGATTENPSFEVISALLSRCQIYILKQLEPEDLKELLQHALTIDPLLKAKNVLIKEYDALFHISGGDARKLLNIFELIVNSINEDLIEIDNKMVLEKIQKNTSLYDKTGEQHYDIISAFIKSIRGSDPNAGVYWLARMIEGGEDPLFIARRLIILASEDIGNANPTALIMANNCFQAVNVIGWPESRIILSQTVIYLACSAKSNSAYDAINKAQQLAQSQSNLSVPLHLRNAPTTFMKELNYGAGYQYAHAFQNNFSAQEFFPVELKASKLYQPGSNQREQEFRLFLQSNWGEKYEY